MKQSLRGPVAEDISSGPKSARSLGQSGRGVGEARDNIRPLRGVCSRSRNFQQKLPFPTIWSRHLREIDRAATHHAAYDALVPYDGLPEAMGGHICEFMMCLTKRARSGRL